MSYFSDVTASADAADRREVRRKRLEKLAAEKAAADKNRPYYDRDENQ